MAKRAEEINNLSLVEITSKVGLERLDEILADPKSDAVAKRVYDFFKNVRESPLPNNARLEIDAIEERFKDKKKASAHRKLIVYFTQHPDEFDP